MDSYLPIKEQKEIALLEAQGLSASGIDQTLEKADSSFQYQKDISNQVLCPSSPPTKNAYLFGILDEEMTVRYTQYPIVINDQLTTILKKINPPERFFRFTLKCKKHDCQQWHNDQCKLAVLVARSATDLATEDIPKCAIRKSCRWFKQQGQTICRACQFIVTRG